MPKTSLKASGVEVSIFPIENGERGEPFTVFPLHKSEQLPARRGFREPAGFIEVAAGQRYGVEVLVHPTFNWMKQPTLSACISNDVDDGAVHFADAIQHTEQTRRDGAYERVTRGHQGNGFAFAHRGRDRYGYHTSNDSEEPFGSIELQFTRGDGKLIPVTQKNRFGSMAKDIEYLCTTRGVETGIDGKDIITEATRRALQDNQNMWLDWANARNIPDLLTVQQRGQKRVYELFEFKFHYRTKEYREQERIERTNKRKSKRRKGKKARPRARITIVTAPSESDGNEQRPIEQESPEPEPEPDPPAETGSLNDASERDDSEEVSPREERLEPEGRRLAEAENLYASGLDAEAGSPMVPETPQANTESARPSRSPTQRYEDDAQPQMNQESPEPESDLPADRDSSYEVTSGYEAGHRSGHEVEESERDSPAYSGPALPSERDSLYRQTPAIKQESPEPESDLPAARDSFHDANPGYEAGHRSGHEFEESERDSPAYSGPALPSERDSLYRQNPAIKQENPEPETVLSAEHDSLYSPTPGYEGRNTSGSDIIVRQTSQFTRPPGYEMDENQIMYEVSTQESESEDDIRYDASEGDVDEGQESPRPLAETDNLYNLSAWPLAMAAQEVLLLSGNEIQLRQSARSATRSAGIPSACVQSKRNMARRMERRIGYISMVSLSFLISCKSS